MNRAFTICVLGISGCCSNPASPLLNDPATTATPINTPVEYALESFVVDSSLPESELTYAVSSSDPSGVDVLVEGDMLVATPALDWEGAVEITLTVIDECDASETLTFPLTVGDGVLGDPSDDPCRVEFTHMPSSDVDDVFVAGDFNDWDPTAEPLVQNEDGSYSTWLSLPPGSYAYKFVETTGSSQGWSCDANSALRQCDEGYSWNSECLPNDGGCNSMVVVDSCERPTISVDALNIDRQSNAIEVSFGWSAASSNAPLDSLTVTLNGSPQTITDWDGSSTQTIRWSDLGDGRQTIRAEAVDADGQRTEELYIPAWLDDHDWETGLMYFAFVDRFDNGDTSNDESYGGNIYLGDYLGGDWAGLLDRMDYLESLGITVLWLTAPWDNPEGYFGGDCNIEVTGYHGYWPLSSGDKGALEEHFGDEDLFRTLIDEAHARNMRVLVDWVGNHVHEQHDDVSANPAWFTEQAICSDANNWNDIPETCWFTSYLPTIQYSNIEPLTQSVRDAVEFAKSYEVDGFRVDAVKHMPHSVHFNMSSLIADEIEHRDAGGDEEFYTVGETFSGDRGLIASYVGEDELDGQFDFNTYWAILSALARSESALYELEATFEASEDFYGDAIMSTFLGNHDVERFIAHAAGDVGSLYGDGLCPDGNWRTQTDAPQWDEPYQRLQLAWTWLLTHEGLPLVYYGDEIGIPGYHDPDNRAMMRFDGELSSREAGVLEHVQLLGQARQEYPELLDGERTTWWGDPDPDVLAWSRASDNGQSLVVINRSGSERVLTNGLSWAGLSPGTLFTDILTGESIQAVGDSLTITVPPWSSRVLVEL